MYSLEGPAGTLSRSGPSGPFSLTIAVAAAAISRGPPPRAHPVPPQADLRPATRLSPPRSLALRPGPQRSAFSGRAEAGPRSVRQVRAKEKRKNGQGIATRPKEAPEILGG